VLAAVLIAEGLAKDADGAVNLMRCAAGFLVSCVFVF
jgi:hypothetical protein